MKQLTKNWFIEGLLDFEYKKYILLAYLQEISKHFDNKELYPAMADLVSQYENLIHFSFNKNAIQNSFPERLESADWINFKLNFEKVFGDDKIFSEVNDIVNFSIPKLKEHLEEGKSIYDFVESNITIFPIGLVPLVPDHGYFLMPIQSQKSTFVYEYTMTIYEGANEKYRGINVGYLKSYSQNFVNTFESIKIDLIRGNRNIPNPAVYAIESRVDIPLEETLLPVAKRSLVKYISSAA